MKLFALLFLFILGISTSSSIENQKTYMRLVVFVDEQTGEHKGHLIWTGTNDEWSKQGRKNMQKTAEEAYGTTKFKDFIPDDECMMVYNLREKGLRKYKRHSGSKEDLNKKRAQFEKAFKTFAFHEIKCL